VDEFGELALREREARRIVRRQWFWLHFVIWASIQIFLVVVWVLSGHGYPWFVYPLFGWGILVAGHAAYAFIVRDPEEIMVERERKTTQSEK
jgi:uncharacterized membrane protein